MPLSSVAETGHNNGGNNVLGGAEDFKSIKFLAFSMELVEIRMNVVED
jgi:hypothetical protein